MHSGQSETHWQTSGTSRVAVANWITDNEAGGGSLLVRVIVNRLWQHHMGFGLVDTSNDLGKRAGRASHPELLDWLASELIHCGWSLKAMHRLIMTSSTYMQVHRQDSLGRRSDPQGRLLWKWPVRRLEAEVIRDAMLVVSGTLEPAPFGLGMLDETSPRRSIYLTVKRSQLIRMLQTFDAPDSLTSVGNRQTTTVAPQALLFLNSPQVRKYAEWFAQRLLSWESTSQIVERGFLDAVCRYSTDLERIEIARFIDRQASSYTKFGRAQAVTDFCHLLLCSNEFVYVE